MSGSGFPDVEIAEEIAILLDDTTRTHAITLPVRQSVGCAVCEQRVPAGSSERLSLLLRPGPPEPDTPDFVLQYAHRRCAASAILDLPTQQPDAVTVRFAGVLRPEASVPAALVCDVPASYPVELVGPDLASRELEQFGFVRVSAAIASLDAPVARRWVLRRVDGDTLVLRRGRTELHRLEGIQDVLPPGWLAAAGTARSCLIVQGTNLGLEQPDLEFINWQLQLGVCVAATVRYRR